MLSSIFTPIFFWKKEQGKLPPSLQLFDSNDWEDLTCHYHQTPLQAEEERGRFMLDYWEFRQRMIIKEQEQRKFIQNIELYRAFLNLILNQEEIKRFIIQVIEIRSRIIREYQKSFEEYHYDYEEKKQSFNGNRLKQLENFFYMLFVD